MFDSNYPETCKRSIIVKGMYNYTSIAKLNISIGYILVLPFNCVTVKKWSSCVAKNNYNKYTSMKNSMLTILFMIAV